MANNEIKQIVFIFLYYILNVNNAYYLGNKHLCLSVDRSINFDSVNCDCINTIICKDI